MIVKISYIFIFLMFNVLSCFCQNITIIVEKFSQHPKSKNEINAEEFSTKLVEFLDKKKYNNLVSKA